VSWISEFFSANQALGVAAYVAGLLLVWLLGFLAGVRLYDRWEAARRRKRAARLRTLVTAVRRGTAPPEAP
jgi:Tfp pilus assembly protein PilN